MTAETRCRRVAGAQHGLIRRDQAIACGMTESSIDRRTASGTWARVLPRVYSVDAIDLGWEARAKAVSLWAGAGSALSHETAAALWEMDGFPPGPLVVSTERSLDAPPGVVVRRVRRFGPADVAPLRGTRVTTPARTLLDLAGVAPEPLVETAVDAALRCSLVSLPKLRWFVQTSGGRGRRGTATMRRILAARPGGYIPPESALERRLWDLIAHAGLPLPVRQHVVSGKGFVARVDLAYPEQRVAIEADSYRWHSGKRAWSHDLARRNRLTALGWLVLNVTHEDLIERPRVVVDHIHRSLEGRSLPENPRSTKVLGQGSAGRGRTLRQARS